MRAEEIKGLMEAYSHVYETPEVLSEGPYDAKNVIATQRSQEGRDALRNVGGYAGLSRAAAAAGDTAGAKRYMQKSQEIGDKRKAETDAKTAADKKTADERRSEDTEAFKRAMNPGASPGSTPTTGAGKNTGGSGVSTIPSSTKNSPYTAKNLGDAQYKAYKAGGGDAAMAKGMGTAAQIIARGRKASASAGSGTPANPVTRPATTSAAPKPATTSATSKPTTPVAPAKPAGSAMDQWAKANPKLAAAKAERDRTRGTSATTNPLMKDMKSSLPAPKSPSPSTASTAFGLAKKGVNLAAGVDLFDLVKGHLLDEGYADSEEGAMVIMVNMSEEWRKSILESYGVQQLDEISQKTATRAFASSKTGEFEGADSDRDVKRTNNLKKHIVRKFGKEAGEHAEKAAEVQTFGRKDASGKSKGLPKSRIEKSDYRTTQDGKMHKQDQRELKTELRIKRDRRLRKEDLEAWVDELIAEGYDLSEYTWEEVAEIYAQELELVDEALTGERYKKVMKKPGGTSYSRKVSADPEKRATKGGRGGESDFGAGDRGSGNKAARRAGTYQEEYVDEAQRARENPEGHDKEEKRKYEPVRGERTPMPPRGDKRREEFEKWYAKQMGR